MRVVIMACAVLWSGLVVGNAPASPKVVMSDKLQGTRAGRIVHRWLGGYVGKMLGNQVTIEQVIVPDIADYLSTGDQSKARFKAKLSNEAVMEFKDLGIFRREPGVIGQVGHIQYLEADKLAEILGESYLHARLLAKLTDENGDRYWYGLIEIKKDADGRRQEIEPEVILLSEKEDFMEFVAF